MKKPEVALGLIDLSIARGYRPGIVLIDAGYGNNTSFLIELEKRKLKYLGGLAKNRKVKVITEKEIGKETRLDHLAESLSTEDFGAIQMNLDKQKTVWVATRRVQISRLEGTRIIAIVMNAPTFIEASDIDYLITNVDSSIVTAAWVVETYSQRNWIEVFYREALMLVGLKRISSPRCHQSQTTFYSGILCLHFHFVAQFNRRIEKALGE